MKTLATSNASLRVFLACVCVCLPFTSVVAQATADARAGVTPLHTGERIRFEAENEVVSADCDVNVLGFAHDTLRVRPNGRCLHGEFGPGEIKTLFSAGEDRGPRAGHFILGLVGGAIAGGILGHVVAGNGCKSNVQSCDGGIAVFAFTIFGSGLGALTGGVAGLAWPAGPTWHPMPMPPNLTISIK